MGSVLSWLWCELMKTTTRVYWRTRKDPYLYARKRELLSLQDQATIMTATSSRSVVLRSLPKRLGQSYYPEAHEMNPPVHRPDLPLRCVAFVSWAYPPS